MRSGRRPARGDHPARRARARANAAARMACLRSAALSADDAVATLEDDDGMEAPGDDARAWPLARNAPAVVLGGGTAGMWDGKSAVVSPRPGAAVVSGYPPLAGGSDARYAAPRPCSGARFKRSCRCIYRRRASAASDSVHARAGMTGSIWMQSTGQGATHRSQPVQADGKIVCIRLLAPTIASTGQAWMHKVQPMQCCSSIRATRKGPGSPRDRSSGMTGRSSSAANVATPVAPPGGQRSMSATPAAIASAYGLQPLNPHFVHWVWGRRASMRSARSCTEKSVRPKRVRAGE